MAEYKLIYFNLRGRAELCRLILQYGGIPHEDFRMERNGEEWPQIKDGKSSCVGLALGHCF